MTQYLQGGMHLPMFGDFKLGLGGSDEELEDPMKEPQEEKLLEPFSLLSNMDSLIQRLKNPAKKKKVSRRRHSNKPRSQMEQVARALKESGREKSADLPPIALDYLGGVVRRQEKKKRARSLRDQEMKDVEQIELEYLQFQQSNLFSFGEQSPEIFREMTGIYMEDGENESANTPYDEKIEEAAQPPPEPLLVPHRPDLPEPKKYEKLLAVLRKNIKGTGTVTCRQCPAEAAEKKWDSAVSHLVKHIKAEKMYQCCICGVPFKYIRYHMRAQHPGYNPDNKALFNDFRGSNEDELIEGLQKCYAEYL